MKIFLRLSGLAVSMLFLFVVSACVTQANGTVQTTSSTPVASGSNPTIMATTSQVALGGTLTIKGTGWKAGQDVMVSIGVQAVDAKTTVTADSQGNFTAVLSIDPQTFDLGPTNLHAGAADGSGPSIVERGVVTITDSQGPAIVATTSQVALGGTLTIKGTGWKAGQDVIVSIGVQAVDAKTTVTADAQGNFTAVLNIDPQTFDLGPTNLHAGAADGSGPSIVERGAITITQ